MFCFNKLFVIIFLISCGNLYSQLRIYNGNLAFATQFDLDTFQNKYDVINGTLRIGSTSSSNPSNITDLSKLLGIKAVWGDVGIENNGKLKNLHGLDSILVAGYFGIHINRNDSLENVDALNNWKMWSSNTPSLDRIIEISSNQNLVSLGFNGIDTLGKVYIINNKKLRNIAGFNNTTAMNLWLGSQIVDSFSGFAKCRFMSNYFAQSNVKSFEGFNNVRNMGLQVTKCTMDSMAGSKKVYAWIDVQDCPNLKHIDFGRPLPPTKKDFTYTTYSLIKNCPKLKTIINPIQFAPSLYSTIENCGVENISFSAATYLSASFLDCPELTNINLPNADTLYLAVGRSGKLINLFVPKASLVGAAFGENGLKFIDFPLTNRINSQIGIQEDNLELVSFPNLVDAVADTYKGRNYGTGTLYVYSGNINKVKAPNTSIIYVPKLEWASIEIYTKDNSIHNFSTLKECNYLSMGLVSDSLSGNYIINPNIKYNECEDSLYLTSISRGFHTKHLDFEGNFKDSINSLKNLSGTKYLSFYYLVNNNLKIALPKLDSLISLSIVSGTKSFTNLSFLPLLKSLKGEKEKKYLGIGYNVGLSMCNTLCDVIKTFDGIPSNFLIGRNALGCNSPNEVLASCIGVSTIDPQYNNINYIQVYPNPSNSGSVVNIPLDFENLNQQVLYELYNISGILVYKYSNESNKHTITLPQLNAGIYVLKCSQGNNRYVGKVVVE
jgi:Secretion system C-terminal sorting domain